MSGFLIGQLVKNIILFLQCYFLVFAANTSEFEQPKRSLSISTGYLEKIFNSNEALVDAPLSIIDSYGKLFDFATSSINENWWSRLLISALELPISYWLTSSLMVPFHEFGHARAIKAIGEGYSYGTAAFGKRFSGISNYWFLSTARLFTPPFFFPGAGEAWTSYGSRGGLRISSDLVSHYGKDGYEISISAAGLNNQSLLSKNLASGIYGGKGHITQSGHYFINKISGFVYSVMDKQESKLASKASDISSLLKGYLNKGYSIEHSDIELQSWVSMLSGTSYALLKGYLDYIIDGDAKVYPAEFFGVRVPDINSYINANGLSLEFVSGYRLSEALSFGLAYEFIWKGSSAHQITPSATYNLASVFPLVNELWLNADLVIGKGIGSDFSAEWLPFEQEQSSFWQRFSYFTNFSLHNALTLYGERNITSLTSGNVLAFTGFLGVRLNY